jgi:hypothetical protein
MRFGSLVTLLLVVGCSDSSEPGTNPAPSASGCLAGELSEYCDRHDEACQRSTLADSATLDPFPLCEAGDAGGCCDNSDVECRARLLAGSECTCVEVSDSKRYGVVRVSTDFNGSEYYYDAKGDLVATREWVDTNAFCHHSSSERWYGRVMSCRCAATASDGDAG